jgi:hypothetical protein
MMVDLQEILCSLCKQILQACFRGTHYTYFSFGGVGQAYYCMIWIVTKHFLEELLKDEGSFVVFESASKLCVKTGSSQYLWLDGSRCFLDDFLEYNIIIKY